MKKVLSESNIRKSNQKSRKAVREIKFKNITVYMKDPLPASVDFEHVLKSLSEKIPDRFFPLIDHIIVGEFDFLKKKHTNAAYMDGGIYVTNNQDDEDDILDDIIHEIAHAIEEEKFLVIYSDGKLESEFLSKRERLFHLLEAHGYTFEYQDFMQTEYSNNFDNLLYFEVGYQVLSSIASNLFYSPYGATSLREYFANGFEAFYHHREPDKIAAISPVLFDKLEKIHYNKE
jgi:ribosome-binding ATPase YchF (GTP1/OBG family)